MASLGEAELEREMQELGRKRYEQKVSKASEACWNTHLIAGRHLLHDGVAAFTEYLEKWRKDPKVDRQSTSREVRDHLAPLSSAVVALAVMKLAVDGLHRPRTIKGLATVIGEHLEDEVRFTQFSEQDPKTWKLWLHYTRARTPQARREVMRRWLRQSDVHIPRWSRSMRQSVGLMMLEMVRVATDLFEVKQARRGIKRFRDIRPKDEVLRWLEGANKYHSGLSPLYMPMTALPGDWHAMIGGGYITQNLRPYRLIKGRTAKDAAHYEEQDVPELFEAVNALQRTAHQVNPQVYEVAQHFWENSVSIAGLPERQARELPDWPDGLNKETNFEEYRAEMVRRREIHQHNDDTFSNRILTTRTLWMAGKFKEAERIYYPMHADTRGRVYPVPVFLQVGTGNDLCRGLLRFADPEPIQTEEDADWLRIHGANCFGQDKLRYEERVAWVAEHEEEIRAVWNDPLDCQWWESADDPWQALAWCLEYGDFLDQGFGFESRLPVSIDATQSGYQIYSLLMRDPLGAEYTNCISTGKVQDLYQRVANQATLTLHEVAQGNRSDIRIKKPTSLSSQERARRWLKWFGEDGVSRAYCKRPVMVTVYGGRHLSIQDYIGEALAEDSAARGEGEPFGAETTHQLTLLTHVVKDALAGVLPSTDSLMAWMRAAARELAKVNVPLHWSAPNGLVVRQARYAYQSSMVRLVIPGSQARKKYVQTDNPELSVPKQVDGFCPNYIHSLDAALLHRTVVKLADQGVSSISTAHDCFKTHAAKMPLMARAVREAGVEIFSEDLVERLYQELLVLAPGDVEIPEPPERGDLDVSALLDAEYAFC